MIASSDHKTRIVLVMVACTASVRLASADVVAYGTQPMTVGVQIEDLKNARLAYRLPTGEVVNRTIDQIRYLQITGWDDFNQAERAYDEGHLPTVVAAYEMLLKKMADEREEQRVSRGKLDRPLLVRCRLLQAYEAMGRFDKSVAGYLDIIESMPAALETLRPTRLPSKGSTFLPPAEQAVRAAIARHHGTHVGQSLAAWLATWPGHREHAAVTHSGPSTTRVAPSPRERLHEQLADVTEMVGKGRWDDALGRLAKMQNPSAGALRPEVFYWLGRAWAGRASCQDDDATARDRGRAGAAFMRVVIQYPGHTLAAESLWRAGELCVQDGRPDLAAALWTELVRTYPKAEPWAQMAADRLAAPSSPSPTQPS